MTGRIVLAASIPGRCAAPPAPAMITRMPAPGRLLGIAIEEVRRPVGRDDPELVRRSPSSASSAAAFSRIGKSERLPPTIRRPRAARRSSLPIRLLALGPGEASTPSKTWSFSTWVQPGCPVATRACRSSSSASTAVAPSTRQEPGPEQADASGRRPDRRVDLGAPALDEVEAEGPPAASRSSSGPSLGRHRVGLDEDVEADRPARRSRRSARRRRTSPAAASAGPTLRAPARRGREGRGGRLPRLAITASVKPVVEVAVSTSPPVWRTRSWVIARALLERDADGVLDPVGGGGLAEVAEHHHRAEDQRGRVDDVLAGVLRRRAVDRLEDRDRRRRSCPTRRSRGRRPGPRRGR